MTAAGAHVVVNGRTEARVQQTLADIRAAMPEADLTGVAADLATAAGAAALVAQIPDADILVKRPGLNIQIES